jgi:hypothetical protein
VRCSVLWLVVGVERRAKPGRRPRASRPLLLHCLCLLLPLLTRINAKAERLWQKYIDQTVYFTTAKVLLLRPTDGWRRWLRLRRLPGRSNS